MWQPLHTGCCVNVNGRQRGDRPCCQMTKRNSIIPGNWKSSGVMIVMMMIMMMMMIMIKMIMIIMMVIMTMIFVGFT